LLAKLGWDLAFWIFAAPHRKPNPMRRMGWKKRLNNTQRHRQQSERPQSWLIAKYSIYFTPAQIVPFSINCPRPCSFISQFSTSFIPPIFASHSIAQYSQVTMQYFWNSQFHLVFIVNKYDLK
jgi:hypothetical protein